MKRRALHILVLTLAGATLNVLVAWACEVWSPFPTREAPPVRWPGDAPLGWSHPGEAYVRASGGTTDFQVLMEPDPLDSGRPLMAHWMRRTGLPMRSLGRVDQREEDLASWHMEFGTYDRRVPNSWAGGLTLPADWRAAGRDRWYGSAPICLPVRPLWPGFAVNTAFYALALTGAVYGPGLVRARTRRRHHRCPACGYNLTGLTAAVCPECGEARNTPTDPHEQAAPKPNEPRP